MTSVGRIEKWNDDRGFGFIAPSGGGKDVFVHISEFKDNGRRPAVGDEVRFAVGHDGRGRAQARDVVLMRNSSSALSGLSAGLNRWVALVVGFFAVLALIWLAGGFPAVLMVIYASMSTIAFAMYALDKRAARLDRWRVPESTLHLVALAGGWPGALLAQKQLRHKTRKQKFQLVFWLTVALNGVALGWLVASPDGEQWLNQLLRLIQ